MRRASEMFNKDFKREMLLDEVNQIITKKGYYSIDDIFEAIIEDETIALTAIESGEVEGWIDIEIVENVDDDWHEGATLVNVKNVRDKRN